MKVLITGGAGYIGSTVASAAMDSGIEPVLLDSLVTGPWAFTKGRVFYHGDIADEQLLSRLFDEHPDIFCTVHCAALISVPESVAQPYAYYRENVCKSLSLLKALVDRGYPRVLFSSSASVYAASDSLQVSETSPLGAASPYARTKVALEHLLRDFSVAYGLQVVSLRYFNPIGADPALRTGPFQRNPSHLLGSLIEVEAHRRPTFDLTGVNWPTRDGTGIRDYVHVWDLALAHVRAIQRFDELFARHADPREPYLVANLGTAQGVTVREFVSAFERIVGHSIPVREMPPRPGDAIGAYANADRAREWLGWRQTKTVDDGIRDALRWSERRDRVLRTDTSEQTLGSDLHS